MKISQRPIRTTIFFGVICGLSFIPLNFALNYIFSWSGAICLTLWLFVSGYVFLLIRWSEKRFLSITFPLLILFLTIFLAKSTTAFFLFALIVISWIRSGICFQKYTGIRLAVEMLLSFVGGILVVTFAPGTAISWALGIWMFFLVQALYFVFIEYTGNIDEEETAEMDPFEQAGSQAEAILSKSFFDLYRQ